MNILTKENFFNFVEELTKFFDRGYNYTRTMKENDGKKTEILKLYEVAVNAGFCWDEICKDVSYSVYLQSRYASLRLGLEEKIETSGDTLTVYYWTGKKKAVFERKKYEEPEDSDW